MAKKDKSPKQDTQSKFVPQGEVQPTNDDPNPAKEGGEAQAEPKVARGFYLKADQADSAGRVDYRFGKEDNYPKKAEGIQVNVDGQEVRMAVTSSGGWANEATKGYNGWFRFEHTTRGLVAGWILFGHGVDPRAFTMPLSFTIVDGTCAANPKREPVNPEGEAKRQEAAKIAREAKKVITTEPTTEGAQATA